MPGRSPIGGARFKNSSSSCGDFYELLNPYRIIKKQNKTKGKKMFENKEINIESAFHSHLDGSLHSCPLIVIYGRRIEVKIMIIKNLQYWDNIKAVIYSASLVP